MASIMTAKSGELLRRYARAAALTPPKVAARTPGLAVDGYWLDASSYFFIAESFDPTLDRVVSAPAMANISGDIKTLCSLDELAALLTPHSEAVDVEALSAAEFTMSNPTTLAVSVKGRDYVIDLEQRRVTLAANSFDRLALYSPDGRYACFIKGHDLWLKNRRIGAERALTTDGAAHYNYGQQSETALCAVSYRKQPYPVGLWSPDSQWLLTHRIDERSLPELSLVQHVPPGGGRPVLHQYKYPVPGDPLPMATYVAIHAESGRMLVFDDLQSPVPLFSPFLLRMAWFDGAQRAWFLRFDRYFKQAELVCLDLQHGAGRVVLTESAPSGYVDLHPIIVCTPNVRTLTASNEIIWASERDGWAHLYLYDAASGALKNPITRGAWQVRDIVHVDEQRRRILFLAGGVDAQADPARRTLCSVNFDGSDFNVLLAHEGDLYLPKTEPTGLDQSRPFRPVQAQAGVSPDGRYGVVRYLSVQHGNRTEMVELQTCKGFVVAATPEPADESLSRPFTAWAADGVTPLHGVMFVPSDFSQSRRYPLVDYIYPGPQVAHRPQSLYSMQAAQARALAELGFVTIMLNNRGMPLGSRMFHQSGYGALLELPLADHAAVVKQLCQRHAFIDAERLGMMGWSGGGFATARALFDYGDVFKVGVAVCGNHDSSLYTSMWSDRYRGPRGPGGWREPSNPAVAGRLKGKLLLMAGDMDENVHLSQTLAVVNALIEANKDFDLLIVPNAGHDMLMTHGYTLRRAWDYFVRHLLGLTPPADFELVFQPYELARFAKSFVLEAE